MEIIITEERSEYESQICILKNDKNILEIDTNIYIQISTRTIGWELPSCGICLYLGCKVNLKSHND